VTVLSPKSGFGLDAESRKRRQSPPGERTFLRAQTLASLCHGSVARVSGGSRRRGQKRSGVHARRGSAPHTRGRPGGRTQGARPRLELCPHDFPNKWFKHESKCNERVHHLSGVGHGHARPPTRGPICSLERCPPRVPVPARRPRRSPSDHPLLPTGSLGPCLPGGGGGGGGRLPPPTAQRQACCSRHLSESLRKRRNAVSSKETSFERKKMVF